MQLFDKKGTLSCYCIDTISVFVCYSGDNGSGSYSGIINGIQWAVNQIQKSGTRGVLNLSLGGGYSAALNTAIETAVSKGAVVAVAAGNDYNADACTKSPASAESALTTAASTIQDKAASFSNVGKCVDIWAPGSNIAAADASSNAGYRTLSGTSMASPHVAGAAAVYLQLYPSATPNEVRNGLLQAAIDIDFYPGTTPKLLQVSESEFKNPEAPSTPPAENSPPESPSTPPSCSDVAPRRGQSCSKLAKKGKCGKAFMQGYCLKSCGACKTPNKKRRTNKNKKDKNKKNKNKKRGSN